MKKDLQIGLKYLEHHQILLIFFRILKMISKDIFDKNLWTNNLSLNFKNSKLINQVPNISVIEP